MKKFLSSIFIALILVGLMGQTTVARAQVTTGTTLTVGNGTVTGQATGSTGTTTGPLGTCGLPGGGTAVNVTSTQCTTVLGGIGWVQNQGQAGTPITKNSDPNKSAFQTEVDKKGCLSGSWYTLGISIPGCALQFSYYFIFTPISLLLYVSGYFFNVLIAVTINGSLLKLGFVSTAWGIVRDLSNMFFILILLYIAVQMILGIGGHGMKKTIANVVIMALLINFSMFFTQVVIDSSNILALVFYNRINAESNGPRSYSSAAGEKKDVSGGIVEAFNPLKLISPELLTSAGTTTIPDQGITDKETTPISILMGITLLAAAIMAFAAYAFLVTGFYFLGRLIELFVLIIFSPFAFMSFTLPALGHLEYLGWDSWLKRLMSVSFMAPIFMFFLYFIFLLVAANPFKDALKGGQPGFINTLLAIIIPAMLILILLLKAVQFAKKGSGQFGDAVMSAVKTTTALALGGAALGSAAVLKGTAGTFMKGAATGKTYANDMGKNRQRLTDATDKWNNSGYNVFKKIGAVKTMAAAGAAVAVGKAQTAGVKIAGKDISFAGARSAVGNVVNTQQKEAQDSAHARHVLDEYAEKMFKGVDGKGLKFSQLNKPQTSDVLDRIDKDKIVKNREKVRVAKRDATGAITDYEDFGGADYGSKTEFKQLTQDQQDAITARFNEYKAGTYGAGAVSGKDNRAAIDHDGSVHLVKEAEIKQGIGSTFMQAATTGSYDVRNLANLIARQNSTGLNKIAIGATAALAMGLRGGFKKMGSNYGDGLKVVDGKAKFLDNLGSTISSALKSAKIDVDLSGVGKEKDDHGHVASGGGGHH